MEWVFSCANMHLTWECCRISWRESWEREARRVGWRRSLRRDSSSSLGVASSHYIFMFDIWMACWEAALRSGCRTKWACLPLSKAVRQICRSFLDIPLMPTCHTTTSGCCREETGSVIPVNTEQTTISPWSTSYCWPSVPKPTLGIVPWLQELSMILFDVNMLKKVICVWYDGKHHHFHFAESY